MGDNQVNIVVTATDDASKVILGISKAFNLISTAVTDVTKKYIDYGAQVQSLALFSGASNEQTSRLIQLSDDAFVSFESLQMAMKQMAQKGLQPTVANMAKLSDIFKKIQDPAEKSKFLLDNFSRAGIEMSKVMDLGGKKILEMNKSIESGLIIDDAKQKSIQATKQKLDEFNDSLDAIRYEAAGALLDIFNQMPKPLRDAGLLLGQFLSPTNVNTLVQFGILVKGISLGSIASGLSAAAQSMGALAAQTWLAVAPIAAVAAALLALVEVFRMNEFKQVAALVWGKIGETVTGDKMRGALATQSAYTALGGGSSNNLVNDKGSTGDTIRELLGMAQGTQMHNVTFNYQPMISTADKQQAVAALQPVIELALRTQAGR